ncbi:TPA: glycosyltransferase [Raoultella ornithinolytica]|uniref:glycosyltransferase n=1 Tax=Raoultella ornithinolytica TaxID=54291 RepID=UPI002DB7239C|nr:glycosyltransferase [Raoultella ornithinolytica]MEB7992221.1 glycosyltransferase [Raoultella ornithinolytica]
MIFYCESRIFSGQERMYLIAACAMSYSEKSIIIINEANINAIDYCKSNGNFSEIITVKDFDPKFSSLFIWFRWKRIYSFLRLLIDKQSEYKTLCVSQGRIESGNIGVIAAKLLRQKVISYIPMVHSHSQMEQKSTSTIIKDLLCAPLYKLPDSFITISDAVARDLTKKSTANVLVVENFIDKKNFKQIDNIPPSFNAKDIFKILLPGRLLNKQKGQLDFIEAIKYLINDNLQGIVCYIVGDGPDKSIISERINQYKLNGIIHLLGNRNDLVSIMDGCDLVVLPSKFEGVPLVLLEAAMLRKQIIASDIVGFNDYLYDGCLFEPSNPVSLANKIKEFLNSDVNDTKYKATLNNVLTRDENRFKNDFIAALKKLS